MQVEIRNEIKDVFQSFGIDDVNVPLKNEAIMMLLAKESRYRAEYNQFKAKYKAEFDQFKKEVEASGEENFEVEDDLMDWEFVSHALEKIEEKKKVLGV